MIRVILWRNTIRRTGFCVSGHAGFAPAGQDIVCAAVSAAVRLTESILASLGTAYAAHVDHKRNLVLIETEQQDVLAGFFREMRALSEEYPEYITATEVRYVTY